MTEKETTFEQILEQLEHVVHDLEQGGLPLEEALSRFEQGVRLSKEGARRLDAAEARIEEILSDGRLVDADVETNDENET